jgi:hypothetical protein
MHDDDDDVPAKIISLREVSKQSSPVVNDYPQDKDKETLDITLKKEEYPTLRMHYCTVLKEKTRFFNPKFYFSLLLLLLNLQQHVLCSFFLFCFHNKFFMMYNTIF